MSNMNEEKEKAVKHAEKCLCGVSSHGEFVLRKLFDAGVVAERERVKKELNGWEWNVIGYEKLMAHLFPDQEQRSEW